MGKRGPRPKAPSLAPDSGRRRPDPPGHFGGAERDAWESLCEDLADAGVLCHADRKLIGLYARNHALLERALGDLDEVGLTIANDAGREFLNPVARFVGTLAAKERQYLLDFGLSPSTRKGPARDAEEDSPLVRIAGGGPL